MTLDLFTYRPAVEAEEKPDRERLTTPARDRLLVLLRDCAWHGRKELERVAGNRYGARLLELKRLGYVVETRDDGDLGKAYRLVSATPGEPQEKRVKVLLSEEDAEGLVNGAPSERARRAVLEAVASFKANKERL